MNLNDISREQLNEFGEVQINRENGTILLFRAKKNNYKHDGKKDNWYGWQIYEFSSGEEIKPSKKNFSAECDTAFILDVIDGRSDKDAVVLTDINCCKL